MRYKEAIVFLSALFVGYLFNKQGQEVEKCQGLKIDHSNVPNDKDALGSYKVLMFPLLHGGIYPAPAYTKEEEIADQCITELGKAGDIVLFENIPAGKKVDCTQHHLPAYLTCEGWDSPKEVSKGQEKVTKTFYYYGFDMLLQDYTAGYNTQKLDERLAARIKQHTEMEQAIIKKIGPRKKDKNGQYMPKDYTRDEEMLVFANNVLKFSREMQHMRNSEIDYATMIRQIQPKRMKFASQSDLSDDAGSFMARNKALVNSYRSHTKKKVEHTEEHRVFIRMGKYHLFHHLEYPDQAPAVQFVHDSLKADENPFAVLSTEPS